MTDQPLHGNHALVTGGGTGIGLTIARALSDAGATVTITGRRAEVLEAEAAKLEVAEVAVFVRPCLRTRS